MTGPTTTTTMLNTQDVAMPNPDSFAPGFYRELVDCQGCGNSFYLPPGFIADIGGDDYCQSCCEKYAESLRKMTQIRQHRCAAS